MEESKPPPLSAHILLYSRKGDTEDAPLRDMPPAPWPDRISRDRTSVKYWFSLLRNWEYPSSVTLGRRK
ncbi:hypothetical protein [Microcoleus sp. Pol12A5]|uniref:hypothetical protein n=1 Tax=Microcoleus sp. Pol12A5 TaxID=3055392 RepID=UPI002FD0CD85